MRYLLTLLITLFTLTAHAQSLTYTNSFSGQSVNGLDIALPDIAPNEGVQIQPLIGYNSEGTHDYLSAGIMSTGYISNFFLSPDIRFMKRSGIRGNEDSGKLFMGFGISAGVHIDKFIHLGSSFKVLGGYRQISPLTIRLSL